MSSLSGCLEKTHSVFLRVMLAIHCGDLPVVLQIDFVANDQEGELVWLLWSWFRQEDILPVIKMQKWLCVCHVVNYNAAISPPIESRTQRLEPLLASSVPYLQYHHTIFRLYFLVAEIRSNRWFEMICKSVVLKHLNQRCLSYIGVPNHHHFDKMFADVSLLRFW